MAAVLLVACAQQGAPTGGFDDRRPPVVVSTTPDTFAVIPDFSGPIRFDFDERISEQVSGGTLNDAVVVSPRTGGLRVRHERRSLVIEMDGGFEPDRVYRVTLQPVVRDLFSNQMRDQFELVFSTGPQPVPTTIAGIVWDRLTGRGAADYEVRAVGTEGDSSVHVSMTDTGGVFGLRFLPTPIEVNGLGAFRFQLTAFEDRNRDNIVDPTEVQGTRRGLVNAADTFFANIAVLQPDTTPAQVTSVTPLDSVTALIEFDDYLDPDFPLAGVTVEVLDEDSVRVAAVRIFHEHEYVAYAEAVADSLAVLDSLDAAVLAAEAAEAAVQDSIARAALDTASVADTVVIVDPAAADPALDDPAALDPAPEDTAEAEPVEPPPERRVAPPGLNGRPTARLRPPDPNATQAREPIGPGGERLPSRQIVALLGATLVPNSPYQLVVTAIRNITAVALGGGSAALVLQPPPAPPDAGAVDDSLAVPDTSVVEDTTVVPDTSAVADTSAVPDTSVVRNPAARRPPSR